MKTFNNRPVFLADVEDDYCTITTISLVDDPAMELPMYCFNKEMMTFGMQDEMKHNIISCIVRTDYPILRLDASGNPFYIVFNRETSEKLCQRLMKDGFQQNISLDHNGQLIDGITLQEVFIKDTEKGISPVGFEDAAEGSLFGVYHIENEDLWNACLDGTFRGVSMESYFNLRSFNKIKKVNMMSKIKDALKRLLMEFNNLSTDKAELFWEEDTELMVGYKVFVEEGDERIPAPDGEYLSDENRIKVENGVVTEIEAKEEAPEDTKEDEPEVPEKEEMEEVQETVQETVEEVNEPDKTQEEDKTAELEARIAELEAKMAELESKIVELATAPAAEPVVDEFEKVTRAKTTGDKKLDKRIAIASALKN